MRLRYVALCTLAAVVLSSSWAFAAPPVVPDPVKLKAGEETVVTVKVEKGKKAAFGEGFRQSDCLFFRGYSESETEIPFLVRPKVAGYFRVVFWTVGEGDKSFLDIDATGGTLPKLPDPKIPDPKDPVTPPTGLYFMVVGGDGPASPAVTAALALPEWGTLVKAGHLYKYKTITEATNLGAKIPSGTTLPVVVVLRFRADGKSSEQLGIVPMPTTGAGVLSLPAAVKIP